MIIVTCPVWAKINGIARVFSPQPVQALDQRVRLIGELPGIA
jgi:hypothetical protein